MDNPSELYESIVALIGQPENDPVIQHWLKTELRAERTAIEGINFIDYQAADIGVSLQSHGSTFDTAFFHIRSAAVTEGYVQPFRYPLVAGIMSEDTQDTIKKKLNVKPILCNALWKQGQTGCFDTYEIGKYQLTFMFFAEGAPLRAMAVNLRQG